MLALDQKRSINVATTKHGPIFLLMLPCCCVLNIFPVDSRNRDDLFLCHDKHLVIRGEIIGFQYILVDCTTFESHIL